MRSRALFAALAAVVCGPLHAATHVWNPAATTGVWSLAGNWSMGGVPTSGEPGGTIVQIGGGVATTDNIAGLVIDQLVFTNGGNSIAGSGATLTFNDPTFPTNIQSMAGTNTIASSLPLVFSTVDCGVIVNAGTLTLAGNISGQGFILQNGSSAGTLALTGTNTFGPVTIREGVVALGSSTPNVAMPSNVTIGNGVGGPSTAVLASNLAEQIADGAAITILSDGRLDLSFTETVGSVNMTGGLVGSVTGSGQLVLSGTALTATSDATGLAAQIVTDMPFAAPNTFMVNDGPGTVDLDVSGRLSGAASFTKAGAGTLQFSGTSSNTLGSTTFVSGGTLLLKKPNGVTAVSAGLTIGNVAGTAATVRLLADEQIFAGTVVASYGTLDLNGHLESLPILQVVTNTSSGAQVVTGAAGKLTLSGDLTLVVNGSGATGATLAGNVSLGGATRTFTLGHGTAASDLTVSAVISGTAAEGLVVAGTGTMLLSSSSTYSGPTTVNGGRLLVDGSTGGGAVTAASGGSGPGTIGGHGTVHGITATTGAVAPGDSPGILSSDQPVVFQSGAAFFVELDGTTAGTQYDQLAVAGSVTLAGALAPTVGYPPMLGDTFTIIQATGPITGTFAGLPEGATLCANGKTLQIHYTSTSVTLTVVATSDTTNPVVTAPAAATVTQTVCQ